MIILLAALLASTEIPTDERASDAVLAFDQLCVQMFLGNDGGLDDEHFSAAQLSPETVVQIKPELAGSDLWDVQSNQSDVRLLVHSDRGMCAVEVAEASEQDIRDAFSVLVQVTAIALDASIQREEDQVQQIEGEAATTSVWRFDTSDQDLMLALTTYPDARFMIQHLMTVSYVR